MLSKFLNHVLHIVSSVTHIFYIHMDVCVCICLFQFWPQQTNLSGMHYTILHSITFICSQSVPFLLLPLSGPSHLVQYLANILSNCSIPSNCAYYFVVHVIRTRKLAEQRKNDTKSKENGCVEGGRSENIGVGRLVDDNNGQIRRRKDIYINPIHLCMCSHYTRSIRYVFVVIMINMAND